MENTNWGKQLQAGPEPPGTAAGRGLLSSTVFASSMVELEVLQVFGEQQLPTKLNQKI